MHRPACHTSPETAGAPASSCRDASRLGRTSRPRGVSLVTILVSLLVVALATIAVGSTIVAKRAIEARDRAKQDLAQASRGFDDLVVAAAAIKPVKRELLQPAVDYYQKFVQSHAGDKQMRAELASANFHLAALHAKLGSKDGVAAMSQGLTELDDLARDPAVDPLIIPSLQDCALKVTTPIEWFMVKGADRTYAVQLVVAINRARGTYDELSRKFPQIAGFRDNFSALLKATAMLEGQLPNGSAKSLESWLKTRDVLETLVRDQPANKDYQVRLAESLVSAARLQKSAKENDKAADNLKRAIEVREQLAAAYPDDKTVKQDLTVAKRDLEKLAAAPAAKSEPPAADKEPAAEPKATPPSDAAPTEAQDAPAADQPPPPSGE